MKTANKFIVAIAMVCLLVNNVMATDSSDFSLEVNNENMIDLQLNNVSESEVQVSLKDDHGITLIRETLSIKNLNLRKYDLSELPDGNYTLTVAYDQVVKVQKINKKFSALVVSERELHTILKPTFREHSNFVDLRMANNSNQQVSVKIRDSEGRTIYKEKKINSEDFVKRFDLSQLQDGTYTIAVKVIGEEITREFTKMINWSTEIATL